MLDWCQIGGDIFTVPVRSFKTDVWDANWHASNTKLRTQIGLNPSVITPLMFWITWQQKHAQSQLGSWKDVRVGPVFPRALVSVQWDQCMPKSYPKLVPNCILDAESDKKSDKLRWSENPSSDCIMTDHALTVSSSHSQAPVWRHEATLTIAWRGKPICDVTVA